MEKYFQDIFMKKYILTLVSVLALADSQNQTWKIFVQKCFQDSCALCGNTFLILVQKYFRIVAQKYFQDNCMEIFSGYLCRNTFRILLQKYFQDICEKILSGYLCRNTSWHCFGSSRLPEWTLKTDVEAGARCAHRRFGRVWQGAEQFNTFFGANPPDTNTEFKYKIQIQMQMQMQIQIQLQMQNAIV